ncbi:MAG: glyoxylate/hydroxypyruvate reductase A [Alphaproteobacteria bacterium]
MMKTLAYIADPYSQEAAYGEKWREGFSELAPDINFCVWPDEVKDYESVHWAMAWAPPDGVLAKFPNLTLIQSIGAGADHLRSDSQLPRGIPVTRMVEPTLTQTVLEHTLMFVLMSHRLLPMYLEQQQRKEWIQYENFKVASSRSVGVLGLGPIGIAIAESLRDLGFVTRGWSRRARHLDGIETMCGEDGLKKILSESEIVILILPNAEGTRHIINAERLALMREGASIVNVGRGSLVDEAALLAALDSGRVASALLDVYHDEPLPPESRFWDHPRVVVTPHIAGLTNPRTAVAYVVDQIRRQERGEEVQNVAEGF